MYRSMVKRLWVGFLDNDGNTCLSRLKKGSMDAGQRDEDEGLEKIYFHLRICME
jgi:hypothetical protein